MFKHWEYTCTACNQSGSVPVSPDVLMFTASYLVVEAHAAFNPQCEKRHRGRKILLTAIVEEAPRVR